jgi:amino acid transporter
MVRDTSEQPEESSRRASSAPDHRGVTHPELEWREIKHGRRLGDRYVRIVRPYAESFRRVKPGVLIAESDVARRSGMTAMWHASRRVLVGQPIPTSREAHERLSKIKGLAVFASDNISSSAYATEEIMRILVLASVGALIWTLPLTLVIVGVLAIVVTSYQQTIRAYPSGGGSYIVASDNLGQLPGLVAGAALLIDYTLTVAVSIAAGVAAITSLYLALFPYRVLLGVVFVALLALGNLRGIRESGTIFAAPTYVYLLAIYGLLGYGLYRYATGGLPLYVAPESWEQAHGTQALGLVLILRAFASGSVALTGTEAIANGVPAFKPPEWRNARVVLIAMGGLFGSIFLGMSFLVSQLGILPDPSERETVVNQLARTLVGEGSPYHYLVQISTALLLVLAANTAFADFPRLASILARDRYVPRQLQFRGDRLAFNVGILFLAAVAVALIVSFHGSVTRLIPLYTVGVFIAFTLSQAGMARHWWKLRHEGSGWRWRVALNTAGAMTTGLVAVVVGFAKFQHGAWLVLVLLPLFVLIMLGIHRHYASLARALDLHPGERGLPVHLPPVVVVPVARLDRPGMTALSFAQSISPDVTAVHVVEDYEVAEAFEARWNALGLNVHLVIIESPYRRLLGPLLDYIKAIDLQDPQRPVTVVLAEFVPRHWWENLLHNLTSWRLKLLLFRRPNTIIIDVPYHVGEGFGHMPRHEDGRDTNLT